VFVSPLGLDANPGDPVSPRRTLSSGLARALDLGYGVVYLASGPYGETGTIALPDGVSVCGGYDPVSWLEGGAPPVVEVNAASALYAEGITTNTTLQGLVLHGQGASSGESAYGIRVNGCPGGLEIVDMTVAAGAGGPGRPGPTPTAMPSVGGPGSPGQPGCENSSGFCETCSRPSGGAPGANVLFPVASGGAGGNAGLGPSGGYAGGVSPGGASGGLGTPPHLGNWDPDLDFTGADGSVGGDGAAGMGADPNQLAYCQAGGYAPPSGGNGQMGAPGVGGGGGGGGGGGEADCDSYGGSGAGGGAGGGGGGGGGGGETGGGSFAIYLWACDATIRDSNLVTQGGGNGGNGGAGQIGGPGGMGGWGGDPARPNAGNPYGGFSEQDDGSNGGRGGNGGAGGHGGMGGGGGGGPSVGIAIAGGSFPTLQGASFDLGPGGLGGGATHPGTGGISANVWSPVTEIPWTEHQALMALYRSTDGPNWTNHTGWMATTTPCSWYGVTCGGGHVVALALNDNHLSGSIPPEMGDLASLESLNLWSNQLSGSIPPELGGLANLEALYLPGNQLSGGIPPELGGLASLRELFLNNNQLSGGIPSALGNLASLQKLRLSYNPLGGVIPPELANLSSLQEISLYANQLGGRIPPELGSLASLTSLILGGNPLGGPLPLSLASLHLGSFYFGGTNLCEPPDTGFQTWLTGIPDLQRTGEVCVPPATVSASPDAGYSAPGTLLTFTSVYSDANGWDDLDNVYFLLSPGGILTGGVYLRYEVAANRLWLRLPDDTGWEGGGAPEAPGAVRTAFATLDYGQSQVLTSADTLTVTWAFTPSYRNSGKEHGVYLRAESADGFAGWDGHGNWIINRQPTLLPPAAINSTVPSGQRITLDPRYFDADGLANLETMYLAIANAPPSGEFGAGAIYLKYEQATNLMYLADSAGTTWGVGIPGGAAGESLENSAVKVIMQYTSAGAADARTQIVRWRVELKSGFAGSHYVYMRARDGFPGADGDTGWTLKGALTIAR